MRRSSHERAGAPLERDVVVDVTTETGVLLLLAARRRTRGDALADEVLRAEAAAERLVALDTGFPGVFRLRLGRHAPEGPLVASGALRCGPRGARAGDERLLTGDDDGLRVPLPRGRQRVDVRAPASDDPEAADFVLTVSPLADRPTSVATASAPTSPPLVEPARHPRPRTSDAGARIEHRARLRATLRATADVDADGRCAALDAYLRVEPRDARALVQRAQLRRALGDLARALDDAWRATTVAPNDRAAWSTLAALLGAAGRRDEAGRAAARARDLAARDAAPRRRTGGRAATR